MTCVLWAFLIGACQADGRIEEILIAHESAVGLVHDLDATIRSYKLSLNGRHFDPPQLDGEYRLSISGRKERHRYAWNSVQTNGRTEGFGDLFQDGTTTKVLLNWDPKVPQKITPRRQGTVIAWFQPQGMPVPAAFGNLPCRFLAFGLQIDYSDKRRTLREFVEGSPRVQLAGETKVGQHDIITLTMKHPDAKTAGTFANVSVDVSLDAAVNYLIRKVAVDRPKGEIHHEHLKLELEVLRFRDFGEGVFVPVEVSSKMYAPELFKGPTLERREEVESITVNADLPRDAFDFSFPKDAQVVELPAVNGLRNVYLWTADNKPGKLIKQFGDLGPMEDESPDNAGRQRLLAILTASVVMICLLFMIYRRGLKK